MKYLLLLSFISFSLHISAQPPLYLFYKTRCQKQLPIVINPDKFPVSIDLKKYITEEVPMQAISIWKKENDNWISIQDSEGSLKINAPDTYLIIVIDPIHAQFIEIKATLQQVTIIQFKHCVLHY